MASTNIKEFSGFGKYASKVKLMVNDDHTETCVEYYGAIANQYSEIPGLCFNFNLDFKRAEETLFSSQSDNGELLFQIMFTQLAHTKTKGCSSPHKMLNQTHAVAAVRNLKTGETAFYDPNGVVSLTSKHDSFAYCIPRLSNSQRTQLVGSKELVERWSALSGNKRVYVPTKLGVQAKFAPQSTTSKYIRRGGYCMFYVSLFVLYFAEMYKNTRNANLVMSQINSQVLTASAESQIEKGIFPGSNSISKETYNLVKVFLTVDNKNDNKVSDRV